MGARSAGEGDLLESRGVDCGGLLELKLAPWRAMMVVYELGTFGLSRQESMYASWTPLARQAVWYAGWLSMPRTRV